MTIASHTAKTADLVQYAIENAQLELNANTDGSLGYMCIWTDNQRGMDRTRNGREYLREGVAVELTDNNGVRITKIIDNALNAGEVLLTGFAARNVELIQGAIESMIGAR